MKKMRWLKRAAALLVCAAAAAAAVASALPAAAAAYASLPHIEEVVNSLRSGSGSFTILEISSDGGDIGYYIGGQEPTATWRVQLAACTSPAARQAYMDSLRDSLSARGLLGTSDSAPLTWSDYAEQSVWEEHDGMTPLTLSNAETASAQGTFTASAGPYQSVWAYRRADGGGYAQNIDHFVPVASGGSGDYAYDPTFIPVNDPSSEVPVEIPDGTAVYQKNDDGTYTWVGTQGQGLALNIGTPYFTVSATNAPTSTGAYAAVSSGYLSVGSGSGYFSRELSGYSYVGGTSGDTVFTPGTGTGTVSADITYRTVYISGGYLNNNWFLKKVFDRTDADLSGLALRVRTVTPDKVTEEMVDSADMIVITAVSGALDPAAALRLYNAGSMDSKKPILVDYRAAAASSDTPTVLQQLSRMIVSRSAAGTYSASGNSTFSGLSNEFTWSAPNDADFSFVAGNVFCFNRDLATPDFDAAYTDETGFSELLAEISNENFLRRQQGLTDSQMLPSRVTMATAVRYVINYGGQRTTSVKTSIQVLELQPGRGSSLTADKVRSWLGDSSIAVNITTMSTSEFVGKLGSLNETYDLIYLGSDATGFNLKSDGTTDFNDNTMDGMLYTNIGDTYLSDIRMSGLLDRDYTSNTFNGYPYISTSSLSRTFRFSGNDLTESKAQELVEFAGAGYPVILEDSLMAAETLYDETTFRVNVTSSTQGGQTVLTASAAAVTGTLPSDPSLYHYVWTLNGSYFSSGTACQIAGAGTYVCSLTISGAGVDTSGTAQSSSWIVSANNMSMADTGSGGSAGSLPLDASDDYLAATAGVQTDSGAAVGANRAIALGTSLTLTASPTAYYGSSLTGINFQYQWQKRSYSGSWSAWSNYTGNAYTTKSLSGSAADQFRCKLTLGATTVYTQTITFRRNNGNSVYYTNGSSPDWVYVVLPSRSIPFTISVTSTSSTFSGITLQAAPTPRIDYDTYVYYAWYCTDAPSSPIGYSSSITVSDPTKTYYCMLTPYPYDSVAARSNNITISAGGTTSVIDTGSGDAPGSIKRSIGLVYRPNAARIDNSSCLYGALSSIIGKPNVMSAAAAKVNNTTVLRYLNLSKPRITLSASPTPYRMTASGPTGMTPYSDGKYYLSYTFRIENETDATPGSTRYDCQLSLDLNADGRYSPAEEVTDVVIKSGGGLVAPVGGVYSLSADTTYTLTRQMPTDFSGFLSWNLRIVKNGASSIHASAHGYTRIGRTDASGQTVRKNLNILQITSSRKSGSSYLNYGVNLHDQQQPAATAIPGSDCYSPATGKSYQGIYGALLASVPDFQVTVTTVHADDSSLSGTSDAILSYLNSNYDMLIIGFDDMYQELGSAAADAIVSYIQTGKSVLFTHDTTSQANVPFSSYLKSDGTLLGFGSNLAYWGYYFNTILRNAVGLDRYGIRSPYRSLLQSATAASTLSQDAVKTLTDHDYTVAYQPGTARAKTAAETQGYTNCTLYRYGGSSSGNLAVIPSGYLTSQDQGRTTSYVSQLNEGQITTYPYDVNTADFSGSDSAVTSAGADFMNVGLTHDQYYQINLNSDDIVVWYCMANYGVTSSTSTHGYYSNLPNDATNAYYIFSKGNVTYSGAGHSDSGNNASRYCPDSAGNVADCYINEAKLFVNTMIAAYRTANESPTVSFTQSSDGAAKRDYLFLAADAGTGGADVLLSQQAQDADARTVFFKISDPNLNAEKKISVSLRYQAAGTSVAHDPVALTGLTVDYADDPTRAADPSNISGGLVYRFTLPDEVTAALCTRTDGETADDLEKKYVALTIQVTSVIDGKTYTGSDELQIRKVGLFRLR